MAYIHRNIENNIQHAIDRGKSVLLLGPRQTGKTTAIEQQIHPDITYSFANAATRLRYEKDPVLLEKELVEKIRNHQTKPIIFIDEVQLIPATLDIAQGIIDQKKAQFILTGSSARKFRKGSNINLLPGRVVALMMDPLHIDELPKPMPSLETLLIYGSLPGIITTTANDDKETDLISYVTTYLEQEIRAEALVRNVGHFARFLEVAASESGHALNLSKLAQDVGVSHSTIAEYYQILEDCLIAERIDPIINTSSHRRLIKSPKYLFFDMGIRRVCANEGSKQSTKQLGELFEQFIGTLLFQFVHLYAPRAKINYWRDASGVEVDFVLNINKRYIPIEVKWSDKPRSHDARHLKKFIAEYANADHGFIVCRTPECYQMSDNVTVLSWRILLDELHKMT